MDAALSAPRSVFRRQTRQRALTGLGLALLLAAAALYALGRGSYPLTPGQVLSALAAGPWGSDTAAHVVWSIRLPRLLAALLAGMGLGVAGAAMQSVLRNPLASPLTLGVSQGAAFGATCAIVLGGGLGTAWRARRVAYLPQQSRAVPVTVFEAVLLGRVPHLGWQVGEGDLALAEDLLVRLGLRALAGRSCAEPSGGELQKVLIARALAQSPRLLLLDEPVNHLDLGNRLEVLRTIRRTARGADPILDPIVLVVLHDLNLALRFADRFLLLDGTGGWAAGPMQDLDPQRVEQVYGVPVVRGEIAGHPLFVPR